jgi:hypothetical protein
MARADATPQASWRPRTPAQLRLARSPHDFSRFQRGDRVGLYLGSHWSGGVVVALSGPCALIRTRIRAAQQSRCIAVHDARNLVPAAELQPAAAMHPPQPHLL